jgi:hypothetical protein
MKLLIRHPVISAVLLTPFLLAMAAVSGGVGHGNYLLAIVLFPYAALVAVILDHFFSSTIPTIAMATLQFPVYGTLIGLGRRWARGGVVVSALLVLHSIATAIALLVVYY